MVQDTPQAAFRRRVWPPHDGNFVYKTIHLFTSTVMPIFCTMRIEGYENMPRTGGCVLTCNHTMGPDFLAIGYACRRKVYFMAKQELFEIHPGLTWLFNTNGVFPIRRGELDLTAIEHALELVKEGHVLGMFPEGTRSRTGKLQRGRSGAARIAIQAQVPVVPAFVSGAGPIFEKSNYWSLKPRTAVTVRIGRPLPSPADPNDSRALRNFTRQIMAAIGELAAGLAGAPDAREEDEAPQQEHTLNAGAYDAKD
jgi:1-acyl-sn-glycerol-3-phosphate acyltransferase